jgi:hypothetical protein
LLVAAALIGTGCPNVHKDPPPPAESHEISSAAPGALGALAGGTDAAPSVGVQRRMPAPDDPFGLGQPPEDQERDAGTDDGGAQGEGPENMPL